MAKLIAVVDDGEMAGDSDFDINSKVPYKEGMTLNDIKQSFSKTEVCQEFDIDTDRIKVAWIINEKTLNKINNSWIECHNDGQVYTMNKMLKELVRNFCEKDIT